MPAILIVEDEAKMLRVLDLHLADEGFTTHAAPDAESGLKILNREKIDLVVTDFKLPGMSGLEFLQAVKKVDAAMPVVVMNSLSQAPRGTTLVSPVTSCHWRVRSRHTNIR